MGSEPEVATLFSAVFPATFVTSLLNGNVWAMQGKCLTRDKAPESRSYRGNPYCPYISPGRGTAISLEPESAPLNGRPDQHAHSFPSHSFAKCAFLNISAMSEGGTGDTPNLLQSHTEPPIRQT